MNKATPCTDGQPVMDRATGNLLDTRWTTQPLRISARLFITPLGALSVTLLVPLILLHA